MFLFAVCVLSSSSSSGKQGSIEEYYKQRERETERLTGPWLVLDAIITLAAFLEEKKTHSRTQKQWSTVFVMCALATKYAWDMHQSKSTELGLKLDLFFVLPWRKYLSCKCFYTEDFFDRREFSFEGDKVLPLNCLQSTSFLATFQCIFIADFIA